MKELKFISNGDGNFTVMWNGQNVDGCQSNAETGVTQVPLVIARAIKTVTKNDIKHLKEQEEMGILSVYSEALRRFDILFEDKEGQPQRHTIGELVDRSRYMISHATPFRN